MVYFQEVETRGCVLMDYFQEVETRGRVLTELFLLGLYINFIEFTIEFGNKNWQFLIK